MTDNAISKSRWLRDLSRFLSLKSQFVLTGNVRDVQAYELQPGTVVAIPLIHCLDSELRAQGYGDVVVFTPMSGFSLATALPGVDVAAALGKLGIQSQPDGGLGLESLTAALPAFVEAKGEPAALIIDFASRLVNRSDALLAAEQALFARAQICSSNARTRPSGDSRRPFYNTVIWIADKESDLPDWFMVENPKIRHIPIATPDNLVRRSIAPNILRGLPDAREASAEDFEKAADTFVNLTDGLLLSDMNAIAQLGRNDSLSVGQIADAIRRYKVGVTEDPWRKIDRARIAGAEEFIRSRVKGQTHAVVHMLDIIKRAVTGVGRSSSNGRPRGVAFLAGPTGVGKTELAKTITSLLFGDESAYIRFDMSEFSAEHADQRLIGAPPGYVGYDAGGELTNAIREKPFSVVLFDEIEKAHPRILDKFLQILDDGVLTSGRGDRVYFSEAIILFTSNLGIYRPDASGARIPNVTPSDGHPEVEAKVRQEIDRHFKLVLNRPEILNRMGENVIVFDFIRRPIAEEIFAQIIRGLLDQTRTIGYDVSLSTAAETDLREHCLADLSNGGRGIRNKVEAYLANPLSRALFDSGKTEGAFVVGAVQIEPLVTLTITEKPS